MKVEFKVSMSDEEKRAGNHYTLDIEVDMSQASREILEKYAIRAYKVELQSQIRPNWTTFVAQCEGKTFKKSIAFGDALFASTKGKVTLEKARETYKNSMANMSPVEKLKLALDDGMIDVDMYEASITKLHDKGEITDDEFDEAMDI